MRPKLLDIEDTGLLYRHPPFKAVIGVTKKNLNPGWLCSVSVTYCSSRFGNIYP